MRTTRTNPFIFDDETPPANERVMRTYWLAPRTSRSATILALKDARPSSSPRKGSHPSDLA